MRDITVLIAGTSRLARECIARHVRRIGQDVHIVAEASSTLAAVSLVRRHAPDLVVLLEDADANEIDAIRSASPRPPHVVLAPAEAPSDANLPHVAAVVPRNAHTPRTMTAVIGRVVSHL